jgi:hypothetical protein
VSVKDRVIARVTNQEYVPTKTVELRPDQAVVDQLKPDWWKSGDTVQTSRLPIDKTDEYDDRQGGIVGKSCQVVTDISPTGTITYERVKPFLTQDVLNDRSPNHNEDVLARPDQAVVDQPALQSEPLFQQIVGQHITAIDGKTVTLEPTDLVAIFNDKTYDGITAPGLPPAAFFSVTLPAPVRDDIAEGDFLLDFSDTLRDQVESVVNPDTRVLRNFDAEFEKPVIAVAGTPFVGRPDSSEVTEDSEQLAEHAWLEQHSKRVAEFQARGQEMFDLPASGVIRAKDFTVQERLDELMTAAEKRAERENLECMTRSFQDMIDAAELGISVHAYRWFKREIEAVKQLAAR